MPDANLWSFFRDFPDPRIERHRKHRLLDIVGIAICATVCGAEGWEEMVEFATYQRDVTSQ